jgi:hypothetical protein
MIEPMPESWDFMAPLEGISLPLQHDGLVAHSLKGRIQCDKQAKAGDLWLL